MVRYLGACTCQLNAVPTVHAIANAIPSHPIPPYLGLGGWAFPASNISLPPQKASLMRWRSQPASLPLPLLLPACILCIYFLAPVLRPVYACNLCPIDAVAYPPAGTSSSTYLPTYLPT